MIIQWLPNCQTIPGFIGQAIGRYFLMLLLAASIINCWYALYNRCANLWAQKHNNTRLPWVPSHKFHLQWWALLMQVPCYQVRTQYGTNCQFLHSKKVAAQRPQIPQVPALIACLTCSEQQDNGHCEGMQHLGSMWGTWQSKESGLP